MSELPFQLQYTLSRSQRLGPLLRIWGLAYSPFALVMFGFFLVESIVALYKLSFLGMAVFGGLALLTLLVIRGLIVGILDVIRVPLREVDILVQTDAAGILFGQERMWLFLDGITQIVKYRSDVWTVQHHNGAVLNIPVTAISEHQLGHLKAAMERGRTPEGIQAVIERGRRIQKIADEQSNT